MIRFKELYAEIAKDMTETARKHNTTGIYHGTSGGISNNGYMSLYWHDCNGSVTRYVYSAAGEKLRATHLTAVPNITVAIGSTRELSPSEILGADSVDYLLGGSLTMRNGRIDKFLFDEGYAQATEYSGNASQDYFTFYYYDRDHLGSIRQVIKAGSSGSVVQRMNYYPFGAQLCDGTTDSEVQPYKYNGKEFDKMHGLNTYDYGARQYDPVTARWDRVDPLCEKYYDVSPYGYCGNNPIMFLDPKGMAPGDFFYSIDEAAIDFGQYYNGASINLNIEFGSTIYMTTNKKGKIGFTYSIANRGENDNVTPSNAPKGAYAVALIHTHGNSLKDEEGNEYINNYFSGASDNVDDVKSAKINKEHKKYDDIGNANRSGMLYSYLVSPNGSLQKYSVSTGRIKVISEDMPSSNIDSDRRNANEPITNSSIFFEKLPFTINYLDPRIRMEYIKLWSNAILGK